MTLLRTALPLVTALVLLAGCSTTEHARQPAPPAGAPQVASPAAASGFPESTRRLKPMPLRTFTVATQCSFRDETGNFGKARVDVENSKVKAMNIELVMPRRGSCRYDLAQFEQTQALPSIELKGKRDCRVRMWEQGEQITVAFAGCHHLCSPSSAHDYVWPLLIDKPTGKCD
ncbi:hypothetical protein [Zoogloea sp.]|uniref:hypothetical protein n=1 Tax=Zoogloea sp. TaxID=49181 RepID=UPI0026133C36|nr:hypothetical protein [Zoogloea sp.]MDD3353079.1 hypothetical protein [Zoogloea sp.]